MLINTIIYTKLCSHLQTPAGGMCSGVIQASNNTAEDPEWHSAKFQVFMYIYTNYQLRKHSYIPTARLATTFVIVCWFFWVSTVHSGSANNCCIDTKQLVTCWHQHITIYIYWMVILSTWYLDPSLRTDDRISINTICYLIPSLSYF